MSNSGKPAATRNLIKSGLFLALVAFVGVALLAGTWELTSGKIAEQRRKAVLAGLNQIISPALYNNALQDDRISIHAVGFFHNTKPVIVYRARHQDEPVAVIIQLHTNEGYNGDIALLVGIDTNGKIIGVRVTGHKETPGLGDAIDLRHSNWVLGFDHHSLGNPAEKLWTVKRNKGYFDQFTGATISPRAVVKAVKRALEYERTHRNELYQLPSMALELETEHRK